MSRLPLLTGLFGLFFSSGCGAIEPKMKLNETVAAEVLESNLQAVPSKRIFKHIGVLSKAEIGQFNLLIIGSKIKRMGYVSSRYYLKNGKSVFGVVIDSSGKFVGIDVTQDDVSILPATSTHAVLVPINPEDANEVMKILKRFSKDKK